MKSSPERRDCSRVANDRRRSASCSIFHAALDPDLDGPSLLARVAEIGAELGAALGTNAIEIVVLNAVPPLLYHRVLRDGARLLSRDLPATTRRAGSALSRYCDCLPQLEKIEAAHHRRIAAGEFGR